MSINEDSCSPNVHDMIEQLQKEVKEIKEKSNMADTLMNFNNIYNSKYEENRLVEMLHNGSWDDIQAHKNNMSVKQQGNVSIDNNTVRMLRRKKIKQHLQNFVSCSTLHGFHFCFDKNYKFRRMIWMVLVACSVGFLLEKLHGSTVKYFKYPFTTTTTVKYVDEIDMPAISICNQNDFRMSKMEGTLLHQMIQQKNLLSRIHEISGEEYASTIKGAKHRLQDMLYECVYKKNICTSVYTKSNCTKHNCTEIQTECVYQTQNCTASNFTTFYQTQGEKCHTFNSEKSQAITVSGTATSKRIEIVINIEHYDYYPDTKDSGLRLIIHDQTETPVLMQGVSLPPGFTSYIQIQKKETTNLKRPYATACGEKKLKYFQYYSEHTCFLERLTDYVVQHCQCKDNSMPGPARVCSLAKLNNCTWPKWVEFKKLKDINCPIACNIVEFQPLLSFAQFPSNKYADKIAQHYNLTGSPQENRLFIRDNFVRMVIYFETKSYTLMEQTPAYDLMIFLGDVGGQLGLFLGTSILTYIEFFDVIAMIIYTKYFEIFKPKTRI